MTTTTSEHPVIQGLVLASALGCALSAGVFFAFSGFVMSALDRLPPRQAIAAMNAINVTAPRPPLMILLFATAAAVTAVMVSAIRYRDELPMPLLLIGAAVYLLGTIALTGGYHVPLNDALAAWGPSSADAASRWADYTSAWTLGNHLRVGSGLTAAVAFALALLRI
jgi:uncharacterized membrane protein